MYKYSGKGGNRNKEKERETERERERGSRLTDRLKKRRSTNCGYSISVCESVISTGRNNKHTYIMICALCCS